MAELSADFRGGGMGRGVCWICACGVLRGCRERERSAMRRGVWVCGLAAALLVICASARGGPVVEIDKAEWKMGKVPRNETRVRVFTLKNSGDEPLVIERIRPSCKSCMGRVDGELTIAPGGSRPLVITYKAVDAFGERSASITVHSNDPERPLLRIRISLEVVPHKDKPALTVSVAGIDVGVVAAGRVTTVEITLGNDGDAPLDVLSIIPSGGCRVDASAKDAVAPGDEMVVPVHVVPRGRGVIRESVAFETNDPDRPVVEVEIEGYAVKGDEARARGVVVVPWFSKKPGGEWEWRLVVENGSEFSVSVKADGVSAGADAVRLLPGGKSGEVVVRGAGGELGKLLVAVALEPPVEPGDAAE